MRWTMMMMKSKISDLISGSKAALAMVLVQFILSGTNFMLKLAANDEMNLRILVAYRLILATAFILPFALIFERNQRPNFGWMLLLKVFLSALLGGSLLQNLLAECLALTSPTFYVAIFNLVPAATFILAIIFRMERLELGSLAGKAKVMGTLVGIGGAMLFSFYKGPDINIWPSTHVNLLKHGHAASSHGSDHVLGLLLPFACCLCASIWLIVQGKLCETYPKPYSCTVMMCFVASIQAIVFAVCVDRDWTQWKLGWNMGLLIIAYTGIVGSGVLILLVTWCTAVRGPVFVSTFNPLMLIIAAITDSLFLGEQIHLASIIGGVLIVSGVYFVLWGKSKDMKKKINQLSIAPLESSPEEVHDSSTLEISSCACDNYKGSNDTNTINKISA